MKTEITVGNGKYTISHNNGVGLKCLRNGLPWRDLVGDGMVLALCQEIESLREKQSEQQPIQMVLHCPSCHLQHIDAPGERLEIRGGELCVDQWLNPPHRSHLCKGCGRVWRPVDVATEGVKAIKTKGRADSPLSHYIAPKE